MLQLHLSQLIYAHLLVSVAGQYGSDVPHWYQKYAWALKFIEFGYTTLFMELGEQESS